MSGSCSKLQFWRELSVYIEDDGQTLSSHSDIMKGVSRLLLTGCLTYFRLSLVSSGPTPSGTDYRPIGATVEIGDEIGDGVDQIDARLKV